MTLIKKDIYDTAGFVRPELMIRKGNTKGRLATRTIPVIENLPLLLDDYYSHSGDVFLFPGRYDREHIHVDTAGRLFREACRRVGIEGASTHSWRRPLQRVKPEDFLMKVIEVVCRQ